MLADCKKRGKSREGFPPGAADGPTVVAVRVERDWPAARRQELRQVEELLTQLHADDPHPQPEDAGQTFILTAGHLDIRHLLEGKHPRVEVGGAVHVAHRHADRHDRFDKRLGGWRTGIRLVGYASAAARGQGQAEKDDDRSIECFHIADPLAAVLSLGLPQSTALTSSISVQKPSASVGWM